MSANQMRLLYLSIIQIFNQMTTLQENINIKQTLTVAVTQSNKDTEIVLKETTTVDVTIKEENQENRINNPLPFYYKWYQTSITGRASYLLQAMTSNILKQINYPKQPILINVGAWMRTGPVVFDAPTSEQFWILVQARKSQQQYCFYTVIIMDQYEPERKISVVSVQQGQKLPPGFKLAYGLNDLFPILTPISLNDRPFGQSIQKNLPNILSRVKNASIKNFIPTKAWIMNSYSLIQFPFIVYWLWVDAVDGNNDFIGNYSFQLQIGIPPRKYDQIIMIFDDSSIAVRCISKLIIDKFIPKNIIYNLMLIINQQWIIINS